MCRGRNTSSPNIKYILFYKQSATRVTASFENSINSTRKTPQPRLPLAITDRQFIRRTTELRFDWKDNY